MAHIEWTSELDIGIAVIDKQHRRIVDYINALHHASENHSREEVGHVIDELIDYTLSHFAFEENLIEEAGYPFVNAHKKVHQLFIKRISSIHQRFKMDEDVTDELHHMLKTWLINHIKSDDDDYAEIVHKNLEKADDKDKSWLGKKVSSFFG